MKNLRVAVEENKAVVTCDDLPVITASPVHISQLFQNLINNAIKYRSEDRDPVIHISAFKKRNE